MKTVKIIPADDGGSMGTRVVTPDGTEVPGVASISIAIEPNMAAPVATIALRVRVASISAGAVLADETIEALRMLGYRIEPIEDAIEVKQLHLKGSRT